MLKYAVITLLGTFALVALSLLLPSRVAVPRPAERLPANVTARPTRPADAVAITAYPPGTIVLEALPPH